MKPLSAPLLIQDPVQFANLMHNIDCQLHDGYQTGAVIGFSNFLREATFSSEECISDAIASAVYRLPRSFETISNPVIPGLCWQPCHDDASLFESAGYIRDQNLKTLTDSAGNLFREEIAVPNEVFDDKASIVRWHEAVDRLQTREANIFPEVVDVEDFVWVRLHTTSAVIAEARYLGMPESKVLRQQKEPTLKLQSAFAFRCPHTPLDWTPTAPKTRNVMHPDREHWSLRTQNGERILMLRIESEQDKIFINRCCDYDQRIVSSFVTDLFIYRRVRDMARASRK